jgi:hypothetical protein
MPVILLTQAADIKKIMVQSQSRKKFERPYLEKSFTKIGLMEWLKVKALSSSPNTTKNKIKQNLKTIFIQYNDNHNNTTLARVRQVALAFHK